MKTLLLAFMAMAGTVAVASYTGAAADKVLQPQEVLVVASDFAFQAPDTISAGLTTFKLTSHGSEPHLMQLIRLEEGRSLADVVEYMGGDHITPPWATFVGGPSVPPAGKSSEITVDLEPGNYAMVCWIPSRDKVRHLAKGMVRSLTVTASDRRGREPVAEVRLILNDYSFQLMEPIRPGRRTIRVENVARQPHEVAIVRLEQEISAEDLDLWVKGKKPRPRFIPVGGALGLGQGEVNYVTADFEPGYYLLLCFVPDADDGLPHTKHGMIKQIRIE